MSTEDDINQRVKELEEENEEIRQTLQRMLPNRRDIIKMGLGAAAGAVGLSATNSSAAAGSDQAGQFCTQPEYFETTGDYVTAESGDTHNKERIDLTVKSICAGEQNNNEVNLTRLVEDGTYTDIADAIANEPPDNEAGTVHIIEPGIYMLDSSQFPHTITYSNRSIAAKGYGQWFNEDIRDENRAAELVVPDGSSGAVFDISDGSTRVEGVEFAGLRIRPETNLESTASPFRWETTNSPVIRANRWRQCYISNFDAAPFDTIGGNPTAPFGNEWISTTLFENHGRANFAAQPRIYGGLIRGGGSSNYMVQFSEKPTMLGTEIINNADNPLGILYGGTGGGFIQFGNCEGRGASGTVALEVQAGSTGQLQVHGLINDHETGILAQEDSAGNTNFATYASFENTMMPVVLGGNNNSHNDTVLGGNLRPGEVTIANEDQRLFWPNNPYRIDDATTSDLSPGMAAVDLINNRYLMQPQKSSTVLYWNRDGIL
ncbi:hypothetical protein [Haloarcula sp. JP-L23]|uniref:hypothetical protein n=1 Tax=Haloarcula sp. JP-L23 TaxID=2716717 RepID=UPI00140EEAA4|nr:hypothetical protein G9465_00040 [Haloarcula sp. JP-L23]